MEGLASRCGGDDFVDLTVNNLTELKTVRVYFKNIGQSK